MYSIKMLIVKGVLKQTGLILKDDDLQQSDAILEKG